MNNIRKMALYKITFPNGKVYFGVSINPEKRLKRHKSSAHKGSKNYLLHHALRKYPDQETFEIIKWGTVEEIFKAEAEYIYNHSSSERKYGYNMALGGTSGMLNRSHSEKSKQLMSESKSGNKHHKYWEGKTFSEEHKKKMSEARRKRPGPNLGRKLTDSWKENISKSTSGENNSFYGRTHSPETLEKMRVAQRKWREEKKAKQ